jgi:hypothetical protein
VRGYRHIGRLDQIDVTQLDPGSILAFAYDSSGAFMRVGHVRARELQCRPTTPWVVAGCYDDHVFEATAIGEECFK